MAKSTSQRVNEYRARLKAERDNLRARVTVLEEQIVELKRLLDAADATCEPSILDELSPEARVELDTLCRLNGKDDAGMINALLLGLAKQRAAKASKSAPAVETAPAPVTVAEKYREGVAQYKVAEAQNMEAKRSGAPIRKDQYGKIISEAEYQRNEEEIAKMVEELDDL